MQNRFFWLCFVRLSFSVSLFSSATFFSCPDTFYVARFTFDCSFLDQKSSHRKHFDNYVSETCEMKRWPEDINVTLASTHDVQLYNCRIPILPHEFLQRLERVTNINLDKCEIKSIDEKTFPSGWGLLDLSMSSNDLTELPQFVFSTMPNISRIDLCRNRIRNIDPNAFNGTTKLKIINLSHNDIEMIPDSTFSDAIHLEILYLSYNFIEHFRVDLSKSKDLKQLQLDNNKMVVLDCSLFDLTTHQIAIDASYNHLREIDLDCAVHLEFFELRVDHNQLTDLTFPKSSLLNGLTKIDASGNHIKNVTFLSLFSKLTRIILNDNHLRQLNGWDVHMFPELNVMGISNNWFNCSYLNEFLKKKFTRKIKLERSSEQLTYSDISLSSISKMKTIHGINCIDDNQSDRGRDIDVEHLIMWCFLASLTAAVAILYVIHFKRMHFINRPNYLCVFHRNGANE